MVLAKRAHVSIREPHDDEPPPTDATDMRPLPLCLILAIAAATGCDRSPSAEGSGSVDTLASGAVRVRNPVTAAWAQPWQLQRVAIIGTADGEGPYSFGRVVDVALGPEERVYVLDALAREVRVFDLAGQHVRTLGGEGDGPGEFRSPYALAFDAQGRLWVADQQRITYSVFDTAGRLVAVHRKPFRWPLTPGQLQFARDGRLDEFGAAGGRVGVARVNVTGDVAPSDSTMVEQVPPVMFPRTLGSGEQLGQLVPYAPEQVMAMGPDGVLWTGVGDTYRLIGLNARGDTVRQIELAAGRAPLTGAELAEVRQRRRGPERRASQRIAPASLASTRTSPASPCPTTSTCGCGAGADVAGRDRLASRRGVRRFRT